MVVGCSIQGVSVLCSIFLINLYAVYGFYLFILFFAFVDHVGLPTLFSARGFVNFFFYVC